MYPIAPAITPGDPKPIVNFATYANRFEGWARKHDARAWAVVQCHDITGQLRYPTAGEVRAMTWSALASGDKGVFWFLYQSQHVAPHTLMAGLVDRDFKPTPLWDEVAKLTKELTPLTPILSELRNPTEVKQDDPLLMVRKLTDGKGVEYLFAVNLDSLSSRIVTIPAPPSRKLVRLPDQTPLSGNSPHACDLPAGGGALFRLD